MTEKNVFAYKLFLSLNISSDFKQAPLKVKVLSSPPPPLLKNLIGGATIPPPLLNQVHIILPT